MKPHGTVGRYTSQRCRCDACREANSRYQRERRAAQAPVARRWENASWLPVKGCLPVMCWCGKNIMKVKVEHLRAGATYTCGAETCNSAQCPVSA